MTRYAFAIAALPVFAALVAPASAQGLCYRPVSQLSEVQLDACRVAVVLKLPPRIENHSDTGVTTLCGE